MKCPFLEETAVRYCEHAPVRKLLPAAHDAHADELCSTGRFTECKLYRARGGEAGCGVHCPFYRESEMLYCKAAPVVRYIPYSDSLASKCRGGSWRYCEVYAAMAHPAGGHGGDGIAAPEYLHYTPNHMWIDPGEDGTVHAGIDALLARALGRVDAITFAADATAVLSVAGVDLTLVLPLRLAEAGANLYLRARPERITEDPYGAGWLFTGRCSPDTLRTGDNAAEWMQAETHRVSEWLQRGSGTLNDGGTPASGCMRNLQREDMLCFFQTFFGASNQ
jgi:glycine cleavage system H lipoate-binding protein